MQFFLTDLALSFTALLGYRALEVAMRRSAPVALLQRHTSEARGRREPVLPKADLSQGPRRKDVPRAPLHRLINFW
jgi:hypothetical protein